MPTWKVLSGRDDKYDNIYDNRYDNIAPLFDHLYV